MIRGGLGNVVLAPISEVLSRLLVQATKTVLAAKDVLIERESFTELSRYLERLRPILGELSEKSIQDTPAMRSALESIELQLKTAKDLMANCSGKSRFYLLMQCRSIVKQIQDVTQELGRCISLIPMATLDVSMETRLETEKLMKVMEQAHFKAAVAEEEIVDRIQSGIRERQTDSDFANDLLLQIARAVGVSVEPGALKQELHEFRKEKEEALLRKSQAEAVQLEQIIALLSRADAATTATEKDTLYIKKRGQGGHKLPPLHSFYCPITRDVMDEPVEITSGQTFERSAIQTWFRNGHRTCPITKVELSSLDVKANQALRQSIEEWRERNTAISIAATGPRLRSGVESDILGALQELYSLSEEKSQHRFWIASEGLIPILIELLNTGQRKVRSHTLATLKSICVHNDSNKEEVAKRGAIAMAVRSLSRDVGEGGHAVGLLLELSRDFYVSEQIGKVQGCILLLVTMLNSENKQGAQDARELLENLSTNDQNVVQMAEANHFKPLVERLTEGTDMSKILMATGLSRMGLTDQGKAALAKEGAVVPLVKMITTGKLEAKSAALGALQNLSTLADNREHMISVGVIPPLLQLLFSVTSVVMSLKEQAAATLANLSSSTTVETKIDNEGNILESDETIYQLLSLLNLAGAVIQGHLLRALNEMSALPSAISVRNKLRTGGGIQLLLPFCETRDIEVRVYAVKLLWHLSGDGHGEEMAEQLKLGYIQALVDLMNSSPKDEEKAAVVGIIGNLPPDAYLTTLLIEAKALPAISNLLTPNLESSKTSSRSVRNQLMENSAAALARFTGTNDLRNQRAAAELDVIPKLVELLVSGTSLAKQRAASVLSQFSQSSSRLSVPIPKQNPFFCGCLDGSRPKGCSVHNGQCSVKTSFCLIEARAVEPLVKTLEEREDGAAQAALGTLMTLLQDDRWENGAHAIEKAQGINLIIRILTVGTSGAKEKAVWILERVFRIEKYRIAYGTAAQMPLIDLTQKGSITLKPAAAKILAHLNVLHNQSTYF